MMIMRRVYWRLSQICREIHMAPSHDIPSDTLRKKIFDLERKRKRRSSHKTNLYVDVPESKAYLDTAPLPMIVTAVGIALFAKLLMMIDESKSQERLERKMKNAPPGQGTVRMLTREEWDSIKDLRPRTPFESKLARPNAKIRTGESVHLEDAKDWMVDVVNDALARAEETVNNNNSSRRR